MRSKTLRLLLVFATGLLMLDPDVVLTQGPGFLGRVLNRRLRKVYPNLTIAFADPLLQPGDVLLAAGNITEPGPVVIPTGWSGTVIGESRPGFAPRITQTTPGTCDPLWGSGINCVIDARRRGGLVQLIGLTIIVPATATPSTGIQAIGLDLAPPINANPLTLRNCRIQGASPTGAFDGIIVASRLGPITIQDNFISGTIQATAIALVGDNFLGGTTPVTATIQRNRITITGVGTNFGAGIGLTGISGGNVIVQRNIIDGGGSTAGAGFGIGLGPDPTIPTTIGAAGAIIRRNTVRNFSDPTTNLVVPGTGIAVDGSPGALVEANLIKDNFYGVLVDPTTVSGPPFPVVKDNNITCTNVTSCKASGFVGLAFRNVNPYNLDARSNFWGANNGPDDTAAGSNCGGTTLTACDTAPGSGLPILTSGSDDCDAVAAGSVRACPSRSSSNSFAGA